MTRLPEDLHRALRDPTPTKRATTWTRGPTTKTCSRTETHPHAAKPKYRSAPAHRRFRLGPGSDRVCSRPICARTAYPSCQNAVPQGQDRPRNGRYYRLTSRHPSANIAPCLVRPKNQFSLTRAALSTCGSAKSKFLSVILISFAMKKPRSANIAHQTASCPVKHAAHSQVQGDEIPRQPEAEEILEREPDGRYRIVGRRPRKARTKDQ